MADPRERPYAALGKRLRTLRLLGGIATQRELIERLQEVGLHYDYTVVSHWETGRRCPSLKIMVAIIKVLVEAGSIHHVAEANELMRLADMRNLTEDEIAWAFGRVPPAADAEPGLPAADAEPGPSAAPGPWPMATWSYRAEDGLAGVSVAADGSRILLGSLGKRVICLDQKGRVQWSAPVGNQAWRVALSADGQLAVAGAGSTRPWDRAGRGLYAFDGEGQLLWQQDLGASVWGLALSADGRTIAAGTDGHEALLLDGAGNLLWRRRMAGVGWGAWVWTAALSADGQTAAVGVANRAVLILDRGGNLLGEHRAGADVFTVSVSADGQTVAAGSSDRRVYLLDGQGRLLWRERLQDKVWRVALSADGQRLVVGAGEKEAHVRAFSRGGQPLWKRYVDGSVSCAAVSADCGIVAVGTRAGRFYLFDGEGEPLYQAGADKMIRDVAVAADGRLAVAVSEGGQALGVGPVALDPHV